MASPDCSTEATEATEATQFTFAESGRTATVRSRFTVMQSLPDFPLQCIITGQYDDEFAYDPSQPALGWHFTQRQMKPRLVGDLART